ncbi:transposase family protein, partial [Allopusillimonas ginsengisoli]
MTEFAVAGKKLYLSLVMDLYNGEIVAYETSHRSSFSLVINMLKKAARKCRGVDGPLLHSDSNTVDARCCWISYSQHFWYRKDFGR